MNLTLFNNIFLRITCTHDNQLRMTLMLDRRLKYFDLLCKNAAESAISLVLVHEKISMFSTYSMLPHRGVSV